jgi:hypothetical protein
MQNCFLQGRVFKKPLISYISFSYWGEGLPDRMLQTKIPIWVYFGGPRNLKCWYNLWPNFMHLMDIWWSFVFCGHLFFPFWYVIPRKIWQPWWLQNSEAVKKLY